MVLDHSGGRLSLQPVVNKLASHAQSTFAPLYDNDSVACHASLIVETEIDLQIHKK